MANTIDFKFVFTALLKEISERRTLHQLYEKYHELITRFLHDISTLDQGHFAECVISTTGDVVDTCSCRHRLYKYPYDLLKRFLFDHNTFTRDGCASLEITLTDMWELAKAFETSASFYDKYRRLMEMHLACIFGGERSTDCPSLVTQCRACVAVDDVKDFLVEHYMHTLGLHQQPSQARIASDGVVE